MSLLGYQVTDVAESGFERRVVEERDSPALRGGKSERFSFLGWCGMLGGSLSPDSAIRSSSSDPEGSDFTAHSHLSPPRPTTMPTTDSQTLGDEYTLFPVEDIVQYPLPGYVAPRLQAHHLPLQPRQHPQPQNLRLRRRRPPAALARQPPRRRRRRGQPLHRREAAPRAAPRARPGRHALRVGQGRPFFAPHGSSPQWGMSMLHIFFSSKIYPSTFRDLCCPTLVWRISFFMYNSNNDDDCVHGRFMCKMAWELNCGAG
jgi:hypothetical protein